MAEAHSITIKDPGFSGDYDAVRLLFKQTLDSRELQVKHAETAKEIAEHLMNGGRCLFQSIPLRPTGVPMMPRFVDSVRQDGNGEYWFGVQLLAYQWFQFPSPGALWTLC